jgi:hypothetical protein
MASIFRFAQAMLDAVDRLNQAPHFGRQPIDGTVETDGHAGQHDDLIFDRAQPIEDTLQLARQKIEGAGGHFSAHVSIFSAAMKASCGMSTLPNWRIFFLPAFCFSSSLRLRVASPP